MKIITSKVSYFPLPNVLCENLIIIIVNKLYSSPLAFPGKELGVQSGWPLCQSFLCFLRSQTRVISLHIRKRTALQAVKISAGKGNESLGAEPQLLLWMRSRKQINSFRDTRLPVNEETQQIPQGELCGFVFVQGTGSRVASPSLLALLPGF